MAVRYHDPFLRTGAQSGPPFVVRLTITAQTAVSVLRGNLRAALTLRQKLRGMFTFHG